MINTYIKQLIHYGLEQKLVEQEDVNYTINMLLLELKMDSYKEPATFSPIRTPEDLEETLNGILDYAVTQGILENDSIVLKDLFDTRMMNALLPKPSQVIRTFWEKYQISAKDATDYYYEFSKLSNYIRTYRVARDKKWTVKTDYGDMNITINLSKPEKDPKMIALAKTMPSSAYPKCQLCMENEGYAGRIDHPARENHRIIPITINKRRWGFQYSPYVYYNEHCIVFNGEHTPMKIDHSTFVKMFDFIELFPHYFVGSNADLPIVGGSILSHDHFQGGNYTFAMAKAPIETELSFKGYEDIQAGIVKWPMSVIRLNSSDREKIIGLADRILNAWRGYTDDEVFIFAKTGKEPHNTITPIARMRDGRYELDLVLRNNITTKEHPLGVYHPWEEYHHIKKENIGLIEVMGLAVLPARLKDELEQLADAIVYSKNVWENEKIAKHGKWAEEILSKYQEITADNIMGILEYEVGMVFQKVLECAGVYKRTEEGQEAFFRFAEHVNSGE